MTMIKEIEKRQDSGSLCKLVLTGIETASKLFCCESNNTCISSSSQCSSTSDLGQCWKINQLDACLRNDSVANNVCQYKNGVFCLKGANNVSYSAYGSAVNWALSRSKAVESTSEGGHGCWGDGYWLNTGVGMCLSPWNGDLEAICSDSLASGSCLFTKQDSGQKFTATFNYEAEVCDNSTDLIIASPVIISSSALSTLTPTISNFASPPSKHTTTSSSFTTQSSPYVLSNSNSKSFDWEKFGLVIGIIASIIGIIGAILWICKWIDNRNWKRGKRNTLKCASVFSFILGMCLVIAFSVH